MKKNYGIFFLCGVIVVLLIIIIWFPREGSNMDELPQAAKEAVSADVKNVTKKIDQNGFQHAVIADKENVFKSLNQLDDSSSRKLDSVLALLNIERKQFKEWRQYNTTVAAKDLPASSNDTGYSYRDQYTSIDFIKPKDTISKGKFNFSYNAEVNYAEYYKKDWFLGRKKQYIDFWIADPRATINGVKRVKIEPKQNKVKVDVNASGVYTDRLNLGVDGGITVGRTRLGAGYYYDMGDKQWKPMVNVKLRLMEF